MGKVFESQFTVHDIVNGDVWLKNKEGGHVVAVDAAEDDYDPDIRRKIGRLSKGDTITAELRSQNPLHTDWKFDDVEFDGR
jgi:hypothetical protein